MPCERGMGKPRHWTHVYVFSYHPIHIQSTHVESVAEASWVQP